MLSTSREDFLSTLRLDEFTFQKLICEPAPIIHFVLSMCLTAWANFGILFKGWRNQRRFLLSSVISDWSSWTPCRSLSLPLPLTGLMSAARVWYNASGEHKWFHCLCQGLAVGTPKQLQSSANGYEYHLTWYEWLLPFLIQNQITQTLWLQN